MTESDQEKKETEKTKKSSLVFIIILFAVLVVILGIGLYKNSKSVEENTETSQTSEAQKETNVQAEADITENDAVLTDEELELNVALDVAAAAKPRILGNPDAPVKISEHSSFTCPHCATFHKENFKKIKADFIDTGIAYLVFDDFPRNKFDLQIGAIARCVPEESYFKFIQLLFETQRDWLDDDYVSYITQNAKMTGASEKMIAACLESEELQEALAKNRQKTMEAHEITGTPAIVINDTVVMNALTPYPTIKIAIEKALAENTQE